MKFLSKDDIKAEIYNMRSAYLDFHGIEEFDKKSKIDYLLSIEKKCAEIKLKLIGVRDVIKGADQNDSDTIGIDLPF